MNNSVMAHEGASVQGVTARRIVAGFIDVSFMVLLLCLLFKFFGETSVDEKGTFYFTLPGLPSTVFLLLFFAYHALMEWRFAGTVGKMLAGLRIVSADGKEITSKQAVVRTALRFIDGLPFLYIVGLACIMASDKRQRIGDLAASTLVVLRSQVHGSGWA
jgi:uncharacterized RDD family membrane protein YckC